MIKSNDTTLKKPWIPPPAKTSKRIFVTKHSLPTETAGTPTSKPESPRFDGAQMSDSSQSEKQCNCMFYVEEVSATNVPMEGTSNHRRTMYSPKSVKPGVLNCFNKLQELQNDLKMMRVHHRSLKMCTELLHRPMKVAPVDERATKNMILQADQNINAFLLSSQEFETNVAALESGLKNGSKETEQYFNICRQNKDVTVLKLLKSYDILTSSMKFLFEVQLQGELSLFEKDQSILNNRIESLKEHLALRDSQIEELEKKLATSLEQTSFLQHEKRSLEERTAQLACELGQSTIVLERMQLQAKSQEHLLKNPSENERLLRIIDELKEKHRAEKEALKKALKMQKYHSEQYEASVSELQLKLSENKNLTCDLAAERDKWKMQLTSANNRLLEAENRVEELERRNYTLQERIKSLDSNCDDQLQKTKEETKKTEKLLQDCERERDLLKETVAVLEKELVLVNKENKNQQKEEQINAKKQRKAEIVRENLEGESKTLIALLQEVKGQFTKKSEQPPAEDKTKQINYFLEIQEKLLLEKEERLRLEKRCEDLEKSIQNSRNASRVVSTIEAPHNYQLQTYIKDYNRILSDENLHQESRKSSEVSVSRSEIQNIDKRVKLLEEELDRKNRRISALENIKFEVDKVHGEKIRELEGKLERSTLMSDSLRRYVETLKSSYSNVFGGS